MICVGLLSAIFHFSPLANVFDGCLMQLTVVYAFDVCQSFISCACDMRHVWPHHQLWMHFRLLSLHVLRAIRFLLSANVLQRLVCVYIVVFV